MASYGMQPILDNLKPLEKLENLMSKKSPMIYYCAVKILGFPFCVLTKEEAQIWVAEDPESHYYKELEIKSLGANQ